MRLRKEIRRTTAFATGSVARAHESRMVFVGAAVALIILANVVFAAQAQDVEEARSSVVKLVSKSEGGLRRTGTGFVVRVEPDLVYIVTASHVVAGDFAPQVEFLGRRNRPVTAETYKTEDGDDPRGIAVLVVRGKENIPERLRALSFAITDDLKGGQEVIAIGFGQGQGDWAVIRASVASIDGRDIRLDRRIEEGNSGGPILKGDQVVGLITRTLGVGQAMPAAFVEGILRRWDVAVTRADPPGSDPRYVLRTTGATQGRIFSEIVHNEVRDGTLLIDGVQQLGPTTYVSDTNIETEILRVSNGVVTRFRARFLAHSWTLTRGTGSERRGGTRVVHPLQGKTVTGETSGGGQWSFSSADGSLSQAEQEELASRYAADDDAMFPSDPVPVGHEWEVSGADLQAALGVGREGSATMRFRRIIRCGLEQCAEIEMRLRLADVTAEGVLLRALKEGYVVKADLAGQTVLNFGIVPGVGNMSVAGRLTSTVTGSVK